MGQAPGRDSEWRLLQRVKVGLVVLLSIFTAHTFLMGPELWPIQRWRMFSGTRDLPTTTMVYQIEVTTAAGTTHRLLSNELGFIADRIIAGAVGPADSPDVAAYQDIVLSRIQTALPDVDIRSVEVWLNRYDVVYTAFPPFDLQAPDATEYLGSITPATVGESQ